jgi:hypothetical protein
MTIPLPRSSRFHLLAILLVALLVRLVVMFHYQTCDISDPGAAFGYETGMISKSLAEGHGFASPFGGDTGPTAWFPPLHPAMQALVFKLFGIQSLASAVVVRLFNIACSLAALVLIFRICRRVWGERFAFIATWAWALYPRAIWFDVTLISYGVLSVLLLLAALDLVFAFDPARKRDWIVQGLLWGVIALANPSLLSLLPICWMAVAIRSDRPYQALRGFVISGSLMFVLVFPWTLRNYLAFHAWIPVRGNMGHELYKGNHYGATGDQDYALNPWNNPAELQEYIRLGERGYVLEHKRVAMQFIHQNPSGAFRLFRRRILLFWDVSHPPKIFDVNEKFHGLLYLWVGVLGLLGIALAFFVKRKHSRYPNPEHWWTRFLPTGRTTWIFATIVFLYPFPYYITFPLDRYRLMIEPILVIFALHLLTGYRSFKAHLPESVDSAVHVIRDSVAVQDRGTASD